MRCTYFSLYDKICQLLALCQPFILVYSTNKIDNFYITEILLKVVFKINHLNPTVYNIMWYSDDWYRAKKVITSYTRPDRCLDYIIKLTQSHCSETEHLKVTDCNYLCLNNLFRIVTWVIVSTLCQKLMFILILFIP